MRNLRACVFFVVSWQFHALGAELNSEIIELTGSRRTKIVWFQHQGDGNDSDRGKVRENIYNLVCFDTDEGKERILVPKVSGSNELYPFFTHDGSKVVFSTFGGYHIFVVNWDGSNPVAIASGQLACVAYDPSSKIEWVYGFNQSYDRDRGPPITRYNLDNPEQKELVWTKNVEANFCVTNDGKHACGNFPWPNCGLADLSEPRPEKRHWTLFGKGCCPSVAPDDRPFLFHSLGNHKRIAFYDSFDALKAVQWQVPINTGEGLNGRAVICPHWTNDVRFLTVAGPWPQSAESDVYLGKFSLDFKSIEHWVRIGAGNNKADVAASAWIEPMKPTDVRLDKFNVEIATIAAGSSTFLNWQSVNAEHVTILPDLGSFPDSGRAKISPLVTTTYRIEATGKGPIQTAEIKVNVLSLASAAAIEAAEHGLTVSYYEIAAVETMPEYTSLKPYKSDVVSNLNVPASTNPYEKSGRVLKVGAVYTGYIEVPADGLYTFNSQSDDGSIIYIGEQKIVDNDGIHGMEEAVGVAALKKGKHPIKVEYFQNGGESGLILQYEGPELVKQIIPSSAFSH